jgi:hypothetical protein
MKDFTQESVDENKNWLPVSTKVRVRETGAVGRVSAVMPDKSGAPWSIYVKLDDDVGDAFATPLVLGPHEVERIDPVN